MPQYPIYPNGPPDFEINHNRPPGPPPKPPGPPPQPPKPPAPSPPPPQPPKFNWNNIFQNILMGRPNAHADIKGGAGSRVNGKVSFYSQNGGTMATAQIYGLPDGGGNCPGGVYNIYIGDSACNQSGWGNFISPQFFDNGCSRNVRAGEMPTLVSGNGYALMSYFSSRYTPAQIVGRSVVITARDNYNTVIACGNIKKN